MSCLSKPTMPTSCSSELFVACPTMINVCDWLMMHHTMVTNGDCGGRTYNIFAVTEYPVFGSKNEHISTNVGIPLGPLSLEIGPNHDSLSQKALSDALATQIDVHTGCVVTYRDQVTLSVKYPLLPSVKAGTYKGDLHSSCGITMSVGVPEVYGTVHVWIQDDVCGCDLQTWLWVEFDFCVFNVSYKGKFAVLPIPRWFISSKLLKDGVQATSLIAAIGGELEAVLDGTNETVDDVSDTTPGTAVTSGPGAGKEANKTTA